MLKIIVGAFVAVTLIAIGAGVYENRRQHAVVVQPISKPPKGESFYGYPSDLVDNTRVDPDIILMEGRWGCSWGKPGSNPWKGDNYSALLAFNVHSRVAKAITERINSGSFVSVVHATNKEVTSDSGLSFSTQMGMTFGETVCYGGYVNFLNGHKEDGKLYTGIDDNGAVYYIAVWNVCGNITRLIPSYEASRNRQFRGPLLIPYVPREAQPYAPLPWYGRDRRSLGPKGQQGGPEGDEGNGGTGNGGKGGGDTINNVAEPSTVLLLLAGVPVILWGKKRGFKRHKKNSAGLDSTS